MIARTKITYEGFQFTKEEREFLYQLIKESEKICNSFEDCSLCPYGDYSIECTDARDYLQLMIEKSDELSGS